MATLAANQHLVLLYLACSKSLLLIVNHQICLLYKPRLRDRYACVCSWISGCGRQIKHYLKRRSHNCERLDKGEGQWRVGLGNKHSYITLVLFSLKLTSCKCVWQTRCWFDLRVCSRASILLESRFLTWAMTDCNNNAFAVWYFILINGRNVIAVIVQNPHDPAQGKYRQTRARLLIITAR